MTKCAHPSEPLIRLIVIISVMATEYYRYSGQHHERENRETVRKGHRRRAGGRFSPSLITHDRRLHLNAELNEFAPPFSATTPLL